MITYDDSDAVKEMAEKRQLAIEKVLMKNTHHAEIYELLIRPKCVY
jgi:DNA adenine methylase